MKKTILAGVGLLCLGLGLGRFLPATAAPVVVGGDPKTMPFEVGKTYSFQWTRGMLPGAKVVEAPKGRWLKVAYKQDGGDKVYWVNLDSVEYVKSGSIEG